MHDNEMSIASCEPLLQPVVLEPSIREYYTIMRAHEGLLADKKRMVAFREAINETVRSGDVVMDIGAGTGILSQYAVEAGASTVYVVEQNESILNIARNKLASYEASARILHLAKRGHEIKCGELPAQPDVIISEMIGTLAFNEGLVGLMEDAKRFAPSGCRMIPSGVRLMAAPYFAEARRPEKVTIFRGEHVYADAAGQPHCVMQWTVDKPFESRQSVRVKAERPFSNVVLWAESRLSDSITLSTLSCSENNSWGIPILKLSKQCREVEIRCCLSEVSADADRQKGCSYAISKNGFSLFQMLDNKEAVSMAFTCVCGPQTCPAGPQR